MVSKKKPSSFALSFMPFQSATTSSRPSWHTRDVSDLLALRTGDGGIWELRGEIVALSNGRRLARLVGVEEVIPAGRVQRIEAPDDSRTPLTGPVAAGGKKGGGMVVGGGIVSRRVVWYVGENGERMRDWRYRPTAPVRKVFPVIGPAVGVEVGLNDGGDLVVRRKLRGGVGGEKAVVGPVVVEKGGPMRSAGLGKGWISAGWGYVGRQAVQKGSVGNKTPMRPGVVEQYSWAGGKEGGACSWVRVGTCPSWYGGGQCMMSLRGVRVKGGRQKLDGRVREWLSEVGRSKKLRLEDADKPAEPKLLTRKRKKFFGIL